MTNAAPNGKPYAGNPHVRFEVGGSRIGKPRRGSLLYKHNVKLLILAASCFSWITAFAGSQPTTPDDVYDREAAYVESTGEQYVDTGVIGRSGTKVEAVFMYTAESYAGSSDLAFMGARKDSGETRFFPFHCNYLAKCYGYGSFRQVTASDTISVGVVHTLVSDLRTGSQTVAYDGEVIESATDATEIDTGANMYLFALNYGGAKNFAKIRIYMLKIYQTDVNGDYRLVRDFVPCAKNGEGGLYDRVNKRLYRSANGTALSVAPSRDTATAISGKPDFFVDYIASDGTQVLDTGVPMRTGVRAEGKMRWVGDESLAGVERTYLGGRGKGTDDRFYMVHSVEAHRFFGYRSHRIYPSSADKGGAVYADGITYATDHDYEFAVDYPTTGFLNASFDGDESMEKMTYGAFDTGYNLPLFSSLVDGVRDYGSTARCYWLKLYLDGELVRDFVPCIKNGKGALYDKVKDEVVFPAGDIARSSCGHEVEPVDGWEYRDAVYVESTGAEYVDTGVIGKSGRKAMADFSWLSVSFDQGFLGSRSSQGEADLSRFYLLHDFEGYVTYGYGIFQYTGFENAVCGRRYVMESELDQGRQFITMSAYGSGVTNVMSKTDDYAVDTKASMYVFACNYDGPQYAGPARLRVLKIWEKGEQSGEYVLTRNFRPVAVKMEGDWNQAIGALRDEVSGKIYFANAVHGGARASLRYKLPQGMLMLVR